MRRAIVAGIGMVFLGVPGALAGDRLFPDVSRQPPSLSQAAPQPWHDAGAGGYRVAVIAAGAAVGVIAANFLTGGLITPLLTLGGGPAAAAVTANAAAPAAAGIGLGAGALLVAAPAAMASMGMMTPLVGAA